MELLLFSDGACSGNPGPGGWAYLIWETGQDVVFGESAFQENTTNNQMELRSLTEGLRTVVKKFSAGEISALKIYSDSKYVIKGATQWSHSWLKNDWKTAGGKEEVKNQDYWKDLLAVLGQLRGTKLSWHYVPGHSGFAGNEFVDEAAVLAYQEKSDRRVLCDGTRSAVASLGDLGVLPEEGASQSSKKKSSSSGKALFYLSLIDGKLERHTTWAECEARVKGRSGARYKKITSNAEEKDILKSWGLE